MTEMRTVTATWARTHFGEIIRNTIAGKRFIVERDDIPSVVILSKAEYEKLQRLAAWSRFYELGRQAGRDVREPQSNEASEEGLTEEEVQAEIETIRTCGDPGRRGLSGDERQ